MGAKERQMKPYLNFYNENGIDTLSFAIGPSQVLFPNSSLKYMEKVYEEIMKSGRNGNPPDALVFHNFSVGKDI